MAATIGYGCTLEIDYGSSSAYVAVADIKTISLPSRESSKVDVTTITQGTRYKQFIPGMKEAGSLSCECLWTATSYAALDPLLGVSHNFKVSMNDGASTPTKYTFTGFIMKIGEMTLDADKDNIFKLEVCLNTGVTITAST